MINIHFTNESLLDIEDIVFGMKSKEKDYLMILNCALRQG
jgi:hypothetical protein